MARKKDEQATVYLNRVASRLKQAIDDMGLTQADVISKCSNKGFTITKSTLSKILNESSGCTLYNIANIAEALKLDMSELFSTGENEIISIPKVSDEKLITTNIANHFDRYVGTYNLYMYRTLSDEPGIMTGKLEINDHGSSGMKCILEIYTNQNYAEVIETKRYEGTVKYSPQMRVLYISVADLKEIGEEVYMIFPYIHLTKTPLECRIGLCLTSCAGTTRIPTALRVMISRNKISDDLLDIIKGHLLLNDSKIRISVDQFKKIASSSELPDSFKDMFIKNGELTGAINRNYYILSEAVVRSSEMDFIDKIKSICVLRNYSEAPKHTKVSDKANEFVYKIMKYDETQNLNN